MSAGEEDSIGDEGIDEESDEDGSSMQQQDHHI